MMISNRTAEIHDALSAAASTMGRLPKPQRELKIVRAKVPGVGKALVEQSCISCRRWRKEDLFKSPGVAETLDWAAALSELDTVAARSDHRLRHARRVLKYQDDIARIEGRRPRN